MKIIHNGIESNHFSILKEYFKKSKEIFIAVAFFKVSGYNLIKSEIENALKNNVLITIICGLDFYQTEPEVLKRVYSLSTKYSNCKLLIHKHKGNITFHPKFYCFKGENETSLIIGSANFTQGGLMNNFELSITETIDNNSKQFNELIKLISIIEEQSETTSDFEISQYARSFQINKRNEIKANKTVKEEENAIQKLDMELVEKHLKKYLENDKEKEDYKLRKSNYIKAKEILEKIRTETLDEELFFSYYEQLVGKANQKSLWHSGSIYRKKATVKKFHTNFQSLLNDVYNNLTKSPEELFKVVEKYFRGDSNYRITGLGINIITEILNTYSQEKFAVLNQNPLTSIEFFGFEEFPHSQGFKSDNYRDFNLLLTSLMNSCNFDTLGQVDHFLNYIYWQVKDMKT